MSLSSSNGTAASVPVERDRSGRVHFGDVHGYGRHGELFDGRDFDRLLLWCE